MPNHPVDTVYVDGSQVLKGDVRSWEGKFLVVDNPNDVQSYDLPNCLAIIALATPASGLGLFLYNSADVASAHSPSTGILVSNTGRRFRAMTANTASGINTALGTGGLSLNRIANGTANTLVGYGSGGVVEEISMTELVALLDAHLGSTAWRTSPAVTNDVARIAHLSSINENIGDTTNYFLMADGRIRACGSDTNSEAGGSGVQVAPFALAVEDGSTPVFTAIYTCNGACYAIDSDGYAWSVGDNTRGGLGHGDTTDRGYLKRIQFFVTNTLTVTKIVPFNTDAALCYGAAFLCSNGKVYVCGYNLRGEFGLGNTTQQTTPVEWGGAGWFAAKTAENVWAGAEPISIYVALDDGTVYAAGYDNQAQMGLGGVGSNSRNTPQLLNIGGNNTINPRKIVSSGGVTGILTTGDDLYVAGDGSRGQMGNGGTSDSNVYIQVLAGSTVLDFTMTMGATFESLIAIIDSAGDHQVRTWGYNGMGQLGMGDTTNRTSPATPAGSFQDLVDEVRASGSAGTGQLFIRAGRQIYGAGDNNNSAQLVVGDLTDRDTFTLMHGLLDAVIQEWAVHGTNTRTTVFVLYDHTCLSGGYNVTNGAAGSGPFGTPANIKSLQDVVVPTPRGVALDVTAPTYTVAGLPSAAEYINTIIIVTNESGGRVPAFSDGTNWRRVTDRAVVS